MLLEIAEPPSTRQVYRTRYWVAVGDRRVELILHAALTETSFLRLDLELASLGSCFNAIG